MKLFNWKSPPTPPATGPQKSPIRDPDAPEATFSIGRLQELLAPENKDQLGAAFRKAFEESHLKHPQSMALPVVVSLHKARLDLAGGLTALAQVASDGQLSERELRLLQRGSGRLRAVLELEASRALDMLHPAERQTLEEKLFEPLRRLIVHAEAALERMITTLDSRDIEALKELLAKPVERRPLDLEALKSWDGGSLSGIERYRTGDRIAVPRRTGGFDEGVVMGRDAEGLQVAILRDGNYGRKTLSPREITEANPLKIGDEITVQGDKLFIKGVDPTRGLTGVASRAGSADLHETDAEQIRAVADKLAMGLEQLPSRRQNVGSAARAFTGGAETLNGPIAVAGNTGDGGFATTAGIPRKKNGVPQANPNEDSAIVGVITANTVRGLPEVLFGAVCDDIGGDRANQARTGAGGRAALKWFEDTARKMSDGKTSDNTATLRDAVADLHLELLETNLKTGQGIGTTFAGVVVRDGHAYVANSGDSRVLHFSKDGTLKRSTQTHNLADQLERSLGVNQCLHYVNVPTSLLGRPGGAPEIDVHCWAVEPGDYLVCVTDGVLRANYETQKAGLEAGKPWKESATTVTDRELGQRVPKWTSGASAAQDIHNYALGKMMIGDGRGDNIGVTVVRVG